MAVMVSGKVVIEGSSEKSSPRAYLPQEHPTTRGA
jgi:hypothetical protein